ncbi:MAG: DUF1800 family protein [Gammaproteobacteria bacterium]|nr:DUF1800 family protein [Gammaproteobacteria bacterium]
MARIFVSIVVMVLLGACGGGGGGGPPPPTGGSGPPAPPPPPPPPTPPPGGTSSLPVISAALWDNTAVRQVLHTFAFGGHASDTQIQTWADMEPLEAVREILVVSPRHDALSPPDSFDPIADKGGTLEGMRAFWASDDVNNPVLEEFRYLFDDTDPNMKIAAELTWAYGVTKYGVNPIRQRIGLFETNYHMVVHQLLGNINDRQMIRYYDDIMNALDAGNNYEDVLTLATLSAAIATQYGHRDNVYFNGEFFGNEDFGREYHQLFFAILGDYDPVVHEEVTIKNTAQALTGIRVEYSNETGFSPAVTHDPSLHNSNDLEILGTFISGGTAQEKFQNLADIAINHPESLDNLPVKIISELADDNLNAQKIAELRGAWRSIENKNLMTFLQDYAASPLFHDSQRFKLLSTLERHFLVQNLMTLNNIESYLLTYGFFRYNQIEGVQVFKPVNNVFGGQRGRDAAASSETFRAVYNSSTEDFARFLATNEVLSSGVEWEKDWRQAMPANPASGGFEVDYVAEWLWQRFIADGLENFGTLERAEVYALLSSFHNFAFIATNQADPDRVYSLSELESDAQLQAVLASLAANVIALDSADLDEKRIANALIGQAVNFIVATPYALVLEGR